jgi:cytochrome c oxidase subunit II
MVAIGIVTAILVTLVAVLIPWLPQSASEEMDRITFTFWFATAICIGIFALVAGVAVYSVIAFRAQPEDEGDGPPIHGHTGLEIAWTALPAVLVIAIGIVSAVVLSKNASAGPNPLNVKVFAQQFAWRFEYPDQKGIKSYELVMPVDRSIRFEMTAADVIHSFWIPQMGQKQDVLPGVETTIVVTPTRVGDFSLICTELCGLGHSTMRAPVHVLTTADWNAWVREQQAAAGGGGGPDGKAVFASAGCGGCHTFQPAGANGAVGPDLDELPAAAEKAGQPLAAFVRTSIVDPAAYVAPGYKSGVMPGSFGESLSEEEIDALVGFLTEGKG